MAIPPIDQERQQMRKFIGFISAIIVAMMLAFGGGVQAQAAVAGLAPITCATQTSCVLDFVGNGGNGYWMARQANGTTWVRLTLVPGWNNTYVAPITCRYEDSCMLSYAYECWRAAQQSNGVRTSIWVRLTLYQGMW
jgi:uncharacterized membrane protein